MSELRADEVRRLRLPVVPLILFLPLGLSYSLRSLQEEI